MEVSKLGVNNYWRPRVNYITLYQIIWVGDFQKFASYSQRLQPRFLKKRCVLLLPSLIENTNVSLDVCAKMPLEKMYTVYHTKRVQWPLFHILPHISKTLKDIDTCYMTK